MTGQDWLEKDFYRVLGVPKDADAAALKKAYRALARTHHPDANSGSSASEKRFKEIGEAYSVLSDAEKRRQYDAVRAMGSGARFTSGGNASQGGAGFEDLFGGLFTQGAGGRGQGAGGRGQAAGGRTRTGTRPSSAGSAEFDDLLSELLRNQGGAPGAGRGAPAATGRDLAATAKVSVRQAVEGSEVSLRVADPAVGVRTVHARLPAGVRDGQKVRLRGKGERGLGGPGDVLVTVTIEPDEVFSWDGRVLRVDVPLTFAEAALGATVTVPTWGGVAGLKVPAGTPSGRVFRLRGRGPQVKGEATDLLATVQVVVPQRLDTEAREAVEVLQRLDGDADPRADLLRAAEAGRGVPR